YRVVHMLTTKDRSDSMAHRVGAGDADAIAGRQRPSSITHVALRLDPARLRRFHRELAARLATAVGIKVTWQAGTSGSVAPSSIELLFTLERLVYRLRGHRLSDRLACDQFALADASAQPPDLVVDLCGREASDDCPALRLLFDGTP